MGFFDFSLVLLCIFLQERVQKKYILTLYEIVVVNCKQDSSVFVGADGNSEFVEVRIL